MSRAWQWLLGAVLSVAAIGLLFRIADMGRLDFSSFSPATIVLITGAYLACLTVRALLIRSSVPGGLKVPMPDWLGLTGRHQLIFTLAPSGLGDLSFPGLSERITGIGPDRMVRAFLSVRLRDALILASAGLAGIGQVLGRPWPFFLIAILILLMQFLLPLAPRLLTPSWRGLRVVRELLLMEGEAADVCEPPIRVGPMLLPGFLALFAWGMSLTAISLAFRALSIPAGLPDLLLIIAVLNLVGAIGLTVAGIGTSEAGLAGVLILLGHEPQNAAAVALAVRPLILSGNLFASMLLFLYHWLWNSRGRHGVQ